MAVILAELRLFNPDKGSLSRVISFYNSTRPERGDILLLLNPGLTTTASLTAQKQVQTCGITNITFCSQICHSHLSFSILTVQILLWSIHCTDLLPLLKYVEWFLFQCLGPDRYKYSILFHFIFLYSHEKDINII